MLKRAPRRQQKKAKRYRCRAASGLRRFGHSLKLKPAMEPKRRGRESGLVHSLGSAAIAAATCPANCRFKSLRPETLVANEPHTSMLRGSRRRPSAPKSPLAPKLVKTPPAHASILSVTTRKPLQTLAISVYATSPSSWRIVVERGVAGTARALMAHPAPDTNLRSVSFRNLSKYRIGFALGGGVCAISTAHALRHSNAHTVRATAAVFRRTAA